MPPCEFHWVRKGLLAGSGKPGLLTSFEEDMRYLKSVGIGMIVTLTEQPLKPEPPPEFGFETIHFPIHDMGFPIPIQAKGVCERILASMESGEAVLLHCRAGLGRTGIMLACCLVMMGEAPEEALTKIRLICPNYVQTRAQESFIANFGLLHREGL